MGDFFPARLPGPAARESGGPDATVTALRMMDHSIRVWDADQAEGLKLANDASYIFGAAVLLALQQMQQDGKLPPPASPEWDRFVDQAAAGDVELALVVMVRDRELVCDERVARRFAQAEPASKAAPVNLTEDLRAMGLM